MLTKPFKGKNEDVLPPAEPVKISSINLDKFNRPEDYLASDELINAVNVALLTGRPLLLTGEPGTGKTQLAYRLAWELGLGDPIKFEVKSTSEAKELFYNFDMIGYFRSAQIKEKEVNAQEFISYQALGRAIINASRLEDIADIYQPDKGETHTPRRSVVLIDEIDKAPRDFPNDILNELDELYFKIPEIGRHEPVRAPNDLAPIVIMTSNSEKNLPDAFLRRCVFHHIEFPDGKEAIERIVLQRLQYLEKYPQLTDRLISIFLHARNEMKAAKPPSLGEGILWMRTLTEINPPREDRSPGSDELRTSWGLLFKKQKDLSLAKTTDWDKI